MKLEELDKLNKEDLRGKIICFPTDTVYGVGCMIDDVAALDKIYKLKHRDLNKPLAILVPNSDSVKNFTDECPLTAVDWMNKYWPGALTIIFKKIPGKYDNLVKGKDTIGLRMPNSKVALTVLNKFGPMATTSVNISNMPPMNDLDEILKEFGDQIDYFISDKEKCSLVSSTVVDVSSDPYKVLRQGDIKL